MLTCHESCESCYTCIRNGECVWSPELGCSVRDESTSVNFEDINGFSVNGKITQSIDGKVSIDAGGLYGELSEENMHVLYRMVTHYMKMKKGRV